jgi:hypothetical protein
VHDDILPVEPGFLCRRNPRSVAGVIEVEIVRSMTAQR